MGRPKIYETKQEQRRASNERKKARYTTLQILKQTRARIDQHKLPGETYDTLLNLIMDAAGCGASDPSA